ncbi:tyrosine recombinase XerS [Vagococcus xieshaowenii]|uniref:Tyrosine recombinase XerS n=2 Tax=Vagococcus xieshaowenii TaxID=2562451 RepID=A0AAJ5EE06_9ENTE|nr:tyrosine recombinase XerS [Vagococcus xieshaowenii]TFZ40667.1 tyrosine recombinase XerS [Vagococcus xieshaowenii]
MNMLQNELDQAPDYLKDFVHHKLTQEFSPHTINEYLKNYRLFFNWALSEHILSDLSPDSLESLTAYKMNLYKSHLLSREKYGTPSDTYKGTLSKPTIKRHLTALKVLFHYLATSYDNAQERPYLSHNPMNGVENVKEQQTLQARADAIEEKLFLGKETHDYLAFIEEDYQHTLSPQALKFFKRDKERDVAINALILASGLRLSEVVNLNLEDVSFEKNRCYVTRKGNKKDSVRIASFGMDYLANYISVRTLRYPNTNETSALFITTYKGQSTRMSGNAIEKMVAKYSKAFRVEVSPHKLRHTLATNLFKSSKDLLLTSQQLGHSSAGQTTALYIHIDNDTTMDALNSL